MPSLPFGVQYVVAPAISAVWVVRIVVNVVFAVAVYIHATRLRSDGSGTVLVTPELWGLATLVGGALIGAAYWVVNASSFRPAPRQ